MTTHSIHTKNAYLELRECWHAARNDPQGGMQHVTLEPALVALWDALPPADRAEISESDVLDAEEGAYRTVLTVWCPRHWVQMLEQLSPAEIGRQLAKGRMHVQHVVTMPFTQAEVSEHLSDKREE